MPPDADVLVVGAGPAGVTAATRCALAGYSTTLVAPSTAATRADEGPGESVHPGVAVLLRTMGAEHALAASARATYRGIWVGPSHVPLGSDDEGPWRGYHIDRRRFDAALLDAARVAGVHVHDSRVRTVVRSGSRVIGAQLVDGCAVRARFTVDASGARRIATHSTGAKRRFASKPLVVRTGVGTTPSASDGGDHEPHFVPDKDGWTWVAPEPGGRCTWTQLAKQGKGIRPLPPGLVRADESRTARVMNARWSIASSVAAEGLLVAGDAAATIDPAAGQGILVAVMTGMMAAHSIGRCFAEPGRERWLLCAYDAWLLEQFDSRVQALRDQYEKLGVDV